MGCSGSAPKHSIVDTSGWEMVFVNSESGTIHKEGADGKVGDEISKCAIDPRTGNKAVMHHWVEDNLGVEWVEPRKGGVVKYTCLDQAEFDKEWAKTGAKGAELEVKDATPGLDEQPVMAASPSEILQDGPTKVGKSMTASGKVVYRDDSGAEKVYLLTGEINDRCNIIEQTTGKVVVSMSQWKMGGDLKFYTKNVDRADRASVNKDKQASKADAAFCGTGGVYEAPAVGGEPSAKGAHLRIRPGMLDEVPVSLFACLVLYSNFDLNGIEC